MRLIIGLMSGTSVDAIDAALVRISGPRGKYRAAVIAHIEHPWPKPLRNRLLAAMAPAQVTTQEICELNFLVAREFAATVEKMLTAIKIKRSQIAAIASHGQTICHLPRGRSRITNHESRTTTPKSMGSTLQLGDVSVIATLTGIRTIGDFRAADMAVGGQGAPLVPFADQMLLAHPTRTRSVQNIGGIANVTYLPATQRLSDRAMKGRVLAFDTGPGNMLIDAIVSMATHGQQRFDRDGRFAAQGTLDVPLFGRLQAHPYFSRRPPKSTGREDFGMPLAQSIFKSIKNQKVGGANFRNLVHTLTRLTAWSIADAYRRFLPRMPDEMILCGGGADNRVLVRMLAEELPGVILRRIDEFGIPNKSKEAASFALLGAATLGGLAGNLPSVTGAVRTAILGVISNPSP